MTEETKTKKKMSTPEQRKTLIEMGLQGASQKMMWSQLGISKKQAETLAKNDEEFAEALDLALVHSQSYWESMLLANLDNRAFNSRLAEIALRGQFQKDYRETRDTKVDAKVDVVIDFKGEVAKLLEDIKKAS
ncbi:MAG: hypothetical protein ACO3AG_05625 [Fluviibacter sp.]